MKQTITVQVNPAPLSEIEDLKVVHQSFYDFVRDVALEHDHLDGPSFDIKVGERLFRYSITIEGSDKNAEKLACSIFARLIGRYLWFGPVERVIWHGMDASMPRAIYGEDAHFLSQMGDRDVI